MKSLDTYLYFDGNCREAMMFYKSCLGGQLDLMPYDAGACEAAANAGDRIMHARLANGQALLMASDVLPGMPFQHGNNFSININCESREEIQKLFGALGQNGKLITPLQDMFWGAHFGMLTDRFGVNWMFNYELPKQS